MTSPCAGRKGDYCTAFLGSRIIRRLRVQDPTPHDGRVPHTSASASHYICTSHESSMVENFLFHASIIVHDQKIGYKFYNSVRAALSSGSAVFVPRPEAAGIAETM